MSRLVSVKAAREGFKCRQCRQTDTVQGFFFVNTGVNKVGKGVNQEGNQNRQTYPKEDRAEVQTGQITRLRIQVLEDVSTIKYGMGGLNTAKG